MGNFLNYFLIEMAFTEENQGIAGNYENYINLLLYLPSEIIILFRIPMRVYIKKKTIPEITIPAFIN